MEKYTLNGYPRDITKKKVKKLRHSGVLPAAVYGYKGNVNVQVDAKDFSKLYKNAGHTSVVELSVEGKNHNVIIDEVQFNPATRDYTHVSLREIRMDEEITAEIPFTLVGMEESIAVKDEASLIILSTSSIEIKGLPGNLPQEITIDVSGFHAGDTLTVRDIKLPEGVHLVHSEEGDLNETVVTTTSAVQEEIVENVNEAIAEAVAEKDENATEGGEATAETKTEEDKK